jgi:hypothetical protein
MGSPMYNKLVFGDDEKITLRGRAYTWTADGSTLKVMSPDANTWDGECTYTISGTTLTIAEAGASGNCSVMYGVYTKE